MSNRITLLEEQKKETRSLILEMCKISEEELSEMQWLCAFECLEKVLVTDQYGMDELPKNREFWNWWLDQWHRRDKIFLEQMRFDAELQMYTCPFPGGTHRLILQNEDQYKYMYKLYHKVHQDNVYLNTPVIEYSFAQVFTEIVRNFNKQL